MSAGQRPGAGGEAAADDGREQLRGDPHGDRQREQHRVEKRAVQREVRHEDQRGEGHGDLQQEHGEPAQPDLELGLGLAFAEPQGDPAELRTPTRGEAGHRWSSTSS
jgi:hypothetical protein